jgi:signal transduction histidine kinase
MTRRPRTRRQRLLQPSAGVWDVALGLTMVAFLELSSTWELAQIHGAHPLDLLSRLLLAGAGLAVGLHRRVPVITLLATAAFTAALLVVVGAWSLAVVTPIFAILNVVARSRVRVWAPATAAATGSLAAVDLVRFGWSWTPVYFSAGWLAGAAVFGLVIELRRRLQTEVQAGERLAHQSREEQARRRMAEERLRLAREVHDVVGHSLAVISLQAGVAEHLLDSRPDEARRAVAAIRKVSKQALDDLRAELAALRAGLGDGSERAPSPRLEALPGLVDAMREAGLSVTLEMAGPIGGLPEVVAAAGYRIVQEALTNVARHAPAATAEIRVAVDADALDIEVRDNGRGSTRGAPAAGSGLAGMRERAVALGGRFEAGDRSEGGFRVWARLPREPATTLMPGTDTGLPALAAEGSP